MDKFRVIVDGVVIHEEYEAMGKYDPVNELFPPKCSGGSTFARVAVIDDGVWGLEVKLLDRPEIVRVEAL